MKHLGPEDDWNEEHLPQAIEIHNVDKYDNIFNMLCIPLHYKFQGAQCIKQAMDEYYALFDKQVEIITNA